MAADSVNTVQCFFDRKFKTPSALEIHKWIFEELKLEKRDVKEIKFDFMQNSLFVKLASAILCEKLARECNGILKFRHIDCSVSDVVVTLIGYGIRKIKVFNLPFEIPDEEISKCLNMYGSVLTVTRDKWPKTFKYPVENGVRTVKINMWKHIPSFKKVCGYRAFIAYTGQPETCSICDAVDHFRKECPRRRSARFARDNSHDWFGNGVISAGSKAAGGEQDGSSGAAREDADVTTRQAAAAAAPARVTKAAATACTAKRRTSATGSKAVHALALARQIQAL